MQKTIASVQLELGIENLTQSIIPTDSRTGKITKHTGTININGKKLDVIFSIHESIRYYKIKDGKKLIVNVLNLNEFVDAVNRLRLK